MNILTPNEATNYVRTEATDPALLMLLPQVDAFIQRATGRDWTADNPVNEVAKAAAGMLLTQWYDNPAMIGSEGVMPFGLTGTLTQLEAEALKYRTYQIYGANGAGGIAIDGALIGDDVIKLVGVYGSSGDQSAKFESEISVCGQIQQLNGGDLSENLYVVILKSPVDDVIP